MTEDWVLRGLAFIWRGIAFTVLLALVACGDETLARAGASYRRDRDCESLQRVAKELTPGTSQERVVSLLGDADYEPTSGQKYYSSSRNDCSLVVDYRRGDAVTTSVQHIEQVGIGE